MNICFITKINYNFTILSFIILDDSPIDVTPVSDVLNIKTRFYTNITKSYTHKMYYIYRLLYIIGVIITQFWEVNGFGKQ